MYFPDLRLNLLHVGTHFILVGGELQPHTVALVHSEELGVGRRGYGEEPSETQGNHKITHSMRFSGHTPTVTKTHAVLTYNPNSDPNTKKGSFALRSWVSL